MEGSRAEGGSRAGSLLVTNESGCGSGSFKNIRILRIRINIPTLLFTFRDWAQDSGEMEETSAILIVAAFFGGGSWSSLWLRRVGKHLFVAILIPRTGTKTQLIYIFFNLSLRLLLRIVRQCLPYLIVRSGNVEAKKSSTIHLGMKVGFWKP